MSATTPRSFPGQVARFCRRHGPSSTLQLVNRHKQPDVWHVDEWRYFLASARWHQLRPGGTIFLQLNRESAESPVHPELLDFFRSIGAEIEGREIEIRAEGIVAVR